MPGAYNCCSGTHPDLPHLCGGCGQETRGAVYCVACQMEIDFSIMWDSIRRPVEFRKGPRGPFILLSTNPTYDSWFKERFLNAAPRSSAAPAEGY